MRKTIEGAEYNVCNRAFYQQFFGIPIDRGMWAGFEFQVPCIKEENACRVFVLGESAANGMPPDMAYAFWRILEKMLEARYPSVRFEVYCVAMAGVNSHSMRAAAETCATADLLHRAIVPIFPTRSGRGGTQRSTTEPGSFLRHGPPDVCRPLHRGARRV
ncbi:MAG TPA: hypothetical protein PKO36_14730 [Candidatus Hydrogenedentes bacterium]|nr:hypothetical protein [Candidatus Hydrogenedentota bacterium]HOV75302.1 hypothetical protein [Candidatus Hydrogenedentota bacterium]